MAKAGDKTSTAWVRLREAKRLVVEAYGDPQLAERLLREWLAAKTVRWTCKLTASDDETPQPTPSGFVGDPAFWLPIDCGRAGRSSVEVNFGLGRAWHEIKYQLFVIGPGVPDEPKAPPLPAAWGIEASREDLLAKLPDITEAAREAVEPAAPAGKEEPPRLEPKVWFDQARKRWPQHLRERPADYASRLHEAMQTAPVRQVWSFGTLRRRLYDKPE